MENTTFRWFKILQLVRSRKDPAEGSKTVRDLTIVARIINSGFISWYSILFIASLIEHMKRNTKTWKYTEESLDKSERARTHSNFGFDTNTIQQIQHFAERFGGRFSLRKYTNREKIGLYSINLDVFSIPIEFLTTNDLDSAAMLYKDWQVRKGYVHSWAITQFLA